MRVARMSGREAWYPEDTGADYVMAKGVRIPLLVQSYPIYSEGLEPGDQRHTPWRPDEVCPDGRMHPLDTPGCALFRLERPARLFGRVVTMLAYRHLSALSQHWRDGQAPAVLMPSGALVGLSGIGRGVPHVHVELLWDRAARGPQDGLTPGQIASALRMTEWPEAR